MTEVEFTQCGAHRERGRVKEQKERVRTILMHWYSDFRATPHPAFSFDTVQWVGIQLSVLACCRGKAACSYSSDVLDDNICHCILSQFLSLSHSLTHANFFSFLFLPYILFPLLIPSARFVPILPSHQPSAEVRGYHTSKPAAMSPSLGSNWVTASGGGQAAWSGTSFSRGSLQHYLPHQQHPHHHHQSTHTSYSYCSAHTPVSTADFLIVILILSLITCSHPAEYFHTLSSTLISSHSLTCVH